MVGQYEVIAPCDSTRLKAIAERNCTYLLRCADGTLYCGWTNDLEKRGRSWR